MNMSDAGNITKIRQIPERLVHYLWSRILHYVGEATNLTAELHQIEEQEVSLVFGITPKANDLDESNQREQLAQNLGTQETELNSDRVNNCTILVANVPSGADNEVLEFLFESRKKGGGPVKKVQLNRQSRWAIIEFCEPNSVDIVMEKLPIVLMETELDIHRYSPSLQANEVLQRLEINGLPKELTQELLTKEIEEIIAISSDETASTEYNQAEDEIVKVEELDSIQLRMLTASNYAESISDQYPNVKVKIDQSKNEISFEGPTTEIESVKLNMYKKLSTFSIYYAFNIGEERMRLYRSKTVREYIKQKLDRMNVVGEWEVRDKILVICSLALDIAACSRVVLDSVVEGTFDILKESAATFLSPLWESKLKELNEDHDILYKAITSKDATKVHVVTTDDALYGTVDEIKIFLKAQLLIEAIKVNSATEFGDLFYNLYEANSRSAKKILQLIASFLSLYHVSISAVRSASDFPIIIEGTEEGIQKAKQRISNLDL